MGPKNVQKRKTVSTAPLMYMFLDKAPGYGFGLHACLLCCGIV